MALAGQSTVQLVATEAELSLGKVGHSGLAQAFWRDQRGQVETHIQEKQVLNGWKDLQAHCKSTRRQRENPGVRIWAFPNWTSPNTESQEPLGWFYCREVNSPWFTQSILFHTVLVNLLKKFLVCLWQITEMTSYTRSTDKLIKHSGQKSWAMLTSQTGGHDSLHISTLISCLDRCYDRPLLLFPDSWD